MSDEDAIRGCHEETAPVEFKLNYWHIQRFKVKIRLGLDAILYYGTERWQAERLSENFSPTFSNNGV